MGMNKKVLAAIGTLLFGISVYAVISLLMVSSDSQVMVEKYGERENTTEPAKTTMKIMLPVFYLEENSKRDNFYTDLEEFKSKHTNIGNIDVDIVPWEQVMLKYAISFSAAESPDVVLLNDFSFRSNITNNRLYSLNEYIPRETIDDWLPEYVRAVSLGGKVYGYIRNTDIRVMYYNKDIFHKAGLNPGSTPRTWNELVDYAIRTNHVTGPQQYGYGFIGAKTLHTPIMWSILVLQQGADIADENGKAVFDSAECIKAAGFYADLINKYKVTPKSVFATDDSILVRDFTAGNYAMIMGGSWQYLGMKNQGQVDFNRIGWFGIPVPEGGKDATISGFWAFAISSHSRNPDLAYELLLILANEDMMKKEVEREMWIPTRKSWSSETIIQNNSVMKGWMDYFKDCSRIHIVSSNSLELYNILNKALQKVWDGADAKQTLKEAADSFNNRYYYDRYNYQIAKEYGIFN